MAVVLCLGALIGLCAVSSEADTYSSEESSPELISWERARFCASASRAWTWARVRSCALWSALGRPEVAPRPSERISIFSTGCAESF
jgi:hypothetical protein